MSKIGVRPHIVGFYDSGAWTGFSSWQLDIIDPGGGVPYCIPHMRYKPNGGGADWADVAAGTVDSDLDGVISGIKAFGQRMFFSVHHEPYGDGEGTPAEYVTMWQYVYDYFAAADVTNVVWVWCLAGYPSHAENADGDGHLGYYPGDAYVDWIGWDPYSQSTNKVLDGLVNLTFQGPVGYPGFYDWAVAEFPDKPLMLCEFGSGVELPGGASGHTEAETTAELVNWAANVQNFPAIKAWQYWNAIGTRDYQITNYTDPTAAMVAWANLEYHQQLDPDLAR
jgi:hypothetical protein